MRTRAGTGARGTAVGLVTALGAAWGHQWAGGTVTAPTLLLVVAASVVAGVLTTRPGHTSPGRVLALALAAQVVWHLAFGPAAGDHMATGHAGALTVLAMPAAHVAIALVATGLALGADRALLRLARAALARLVAPAPARPSYDVTSVPVTPRPAPAHDSGAGGTAPVRGPPERSRPRPLAPAR